MKIRVGSRESMLAIAQSNIVIDAIRKYDSNIDIELITMKTTGDIIQDRTLDKIGGKGLFVKELDAALSKHMVDITVHSFKDMPVDISEQLPIVAVSKREDVRDCLILPRGVRDIDYSKPIGCSSKRRAMHIRGLYPDIHIAPIRGNVQTRLRKLDSGEYSAIILAVSGIKRLGLDYRISRIFSTDEIIPAACQGVIAVQSRLGFDTSFLEHFHDRHSWDISSIERQFIKTLDGGCSSPVAAFAKYAGEGISLMGFYVDDDGNCYKKEVFSKNIDDIGYTLALDMKKEAVL